MTRRKPRTFWLVVDRDGLQKLDLTKYGAHCEKKELNASYPEVGPWRVIRVVEQLPAQRKARTRAKSKG